MNQVIFYIVVFLLGFISSGIMLELEAQETGVVRFDTKTFFCQEQKGENL